MHVSSKTPVKHEGKVFSSVFFLSPFYMDFIKFWMSISQKLRFSVKT